MATVSASLRTFDQINNVTNSQDRLNDSFNRGEIASNGLIGKIKGLGISYEDIAKLMQKGAEITDSYINQNSRLALINDGLQTQGELQDKVYNSAQRSRVSYGNMADSVTKLGSIGKDTFKSNDETIAFAELMNKSFQISGANTSEQSNGMNNITQAMAAGGLQGDEFNSIMKDSPVLAQAISNYTGKSMGELQEMSSKGEITANIMKNALFSAVDDINAKFETMPMTFGAVWTSIKNKAVMAFSTIMQKVNNFLNSSTGTSAINGITNSLTALANSVEFVIDMVMLATTFIIDNIEIIKAVIIGLAIIAIAKAIQVAGTWIAANIAYATTAIGCAFLTAQEWIVTNWPLLAIIATLLIIGGVLMSLGVTTEQVVGFIGGIFGTLGAFIFNIVAFVWNIFASLAEFLVNIFNDPLYAIKRLFANIWNEVVNLVATAIGGIIDLINLIPGIDIDTKGISKDFKMDIGTPPKNYWEAPKMPMKDLGDSFKFGYEKGSNLAKNFKMPSMDKFKKMPNRDDLNKIPSIDNLNKMQGLGELSPGGLDDTSKKHVENIDDKVDISNEHLEVLRDLAEIESIQNFISLTPTVQVTTGDIREEADINKIINKIETYMENELVNSAEGVYA